MKYLTTLCSRGGTGRRKGLKILAAFSQNIAKLGILRVSRQEMKELNSFVNVSDRPNFGAFGKITQNKDEFRAYFLDIRV